MSRGRPRQVSPVATLLLAALLTGCAGSPAGSPADSAADGSATLPPSHRVRIGLTEWAVLTGSQRFAPGADVAVVTNAGATAHDLRIDGPGVAVQTRLLRPGQQVVLRFTARPGETLRLWCTVPGHDEAGMDTARVVSQRR